MEKPLTVLIVDDESLARRGVKKMISSEIHHFRVVGEAANGKEGFAAALALQPDIIITDIKMPLIDGLELMALLRDAEIEAKIIVLSAYEEFEYAQSAINLGASDYLLKPVFKQRLIESVLRIGAIIQAERTKKQYLDKLKQELPAIKKQFMLDLLTGSINDPDEICSKLSFLEIPLTFKNQIVLVIKIDEVELLFQKLGKEQQEKLRVWFVESVTWTILLQGNFKGIVFDKNLEEIIIILQIERYNEATIAAIKSSCNDLIAELKTKVDIINTVSIGISDLSPDLRMLNEAYQAALIACNTKFLPGSSVTYINDDGVRGCHSVVKAAVIYLKNNYHQDITVEMVARKLYVSPSHLMHLFKAELGKTFNECLIDYRIERAKELLKDKKYKIYEVCEQVGYNDTRYFSQLFKRVTGFSPSEYIKLIS